MGYRSLIKVKKNPLGPTFYLNKKSKKSHIKKKSKSSFFASHITKRKFIYEI